MRQAFEDGVLRQPGHVHGLVGALGDGHGGSGQQALVNKGELLRLLLVLLDHHIGQLLQLLGEGQQQGGGGDVEHAVDHGNAGGINGGVHEGVVEDEIAAVKGGQTGGGADEVEGDVDHRHPARIAVDADAAQECGHAGADVLTHDDGQGHAVGDAAGEGEGLENTYGGGGGLNHPGEHRAHQHAQEGVGEGGEDGVELRHVR